MARQEQHFPQPRMIERLRRICQEDERVVPAMLYGSFPQQEADPYSDIDCALFFEDAALPTINQREWVSRIAPLSLFYINEFGNRVAIFSNLVRGEFHFDPASEMERVESWRYAASFPSVEAPPSWTGAGSSPVTSRDSSILPPSATHRSRRATSATVFSTGCSLVATCLQGESTHGLWNY